MDQSSDQAVEQEMAQQPDRLEELEAEQDDQETAFDQDQSNQVEEKIKAKQDQETAQNPSDQADEEDEVQDYEDEEDQELPNNRRHAQSPERGVATTPSSPRKLPGNPLDENSLEDPLRAASATQKSSQEASSRRTSSEAASAELDSLAKPAKGVRTSTSGSTADTSQTPRGGRGGPKAGKGDRSNQARNSRGQNKNKQEKMRQLKKLYDPVPTEEEMRVIGMFLYEMDHLERQNQHSITDSWPRWLTNDELVIQAFRRNGRLREPALLNAILDQHLRQGPISMDKIVHLVERLMKFCLMFSLVEEIPEKADSSEIEQAHKQWKKNFAPETRTMKRKILSPHVEFGTRIALIVKAYIIPTPFHVEKEQWEKIVSGAMRKVFSTKEGLENKRCFPENVPKSSIDMLETKLATARAALGNTHVSIRETEFKRNDLTFLQEAIRQQEDSWTAELEDKDQKLVQLDCELGYAHQELKKAKREVRSLRRSKKRSRSRSRSMSDRDTHRRKRRKHSSSRRRLSPSASRSPTRSRSRRSPSRSQSRS